MYRLFGLLLISAISTNALGQSISLSGKVSNRSGKPIAGAIVALAGRNIKDTTDAQGNYAITGDPVATTAGPIVRGAERISLKNGTVQFEITNPAPIKIELFDIKGHLLENASAHPASAGTYRFDIMSHRHAANIMAIRISIGRKASTFRYLPLSNGLYATPAAIAGTSIGNGFAGREAVVDSLKIIAVNYMPQAIAITSYQGVTDATLDSMTLAKFSFFATSLTGLQTLAKNTDGFGGDFRMGKTGPGAGLLGADSICQCLAEKSMPGSKVKQWRAFLSVKQGPAGTQVNAIDRIGSGPWYDRLGRIVSSNLTELANTRPAGADDEIINDLPNEDGVPNHRPDPTKPQVDNHQFVTGSGADGKLYSATATCQDWTSAAATGSKPRAGLSWPQSMSNGKKHWISVFDLWGCEPGLDLTDASRNGEDGVYTIGNGGGYGGFYCFALTP